MGVSFFFPWITTRYPKILGDYKLERMPIIDHLYLDINGIVHICAKDPSSLYKDILCGKKVQGIFIDILNYLNLVINKARPRKTIVIAIDGVCPKSKMLNQRDRRFHSDRDSKEMMDFLTFNLNLNPNVPNFKSNQISVGTEFMTELNKNVAFFIEKKFEEDERWRHLKVYYTDGTVPGEGEHNIFQFIRSWK